jgi:hypothetical protein
MLMFKKIIFLTCLCASVAVEAQKAKALSATVTQQMRLEEDTLVVLAYAVLNDSVEVERFAACRQLITKLVRSLKNDNSFSYPFERLKSISIQYPPDSSFRIFTWQLFVNDSTYRYYGALQRNNRKLELFPLIDRSFEMDYPRPEEQQLTADRWYGALYYNIRQYDTKKGRQYMLFGFDAFEFFEKRKVIDVLSFSPEGKPVFGAPVFQTSPDELAKQRLIFQYSSEASVRCNWDDNYQMVLFDHLIPWGSPFGRGMTQVPDGSYDGLRFDKGEWVFVPKVFNDVQAEAPDDPTAPVQKEAKNLFGDERGANRMKKKAKNKHPMP